ncbi:MAG TPA: hypothetical protein VFZ52_22185 [Chryseolinea sp.]
MAPIKLGNITVEIAVKNIDGYIHELIDIPVKSGFWIAFTVRNEQGKTETFPLVDSDHKIKVYNTYGDALHDAAQKLLKNKMAENHHSTSQE